MHAGTSALLNDFIIVPQITVPQSTYDADAELSVSSTIFQSQQSTSGPLA
jgi:hypothetical protein